MSAIATAAAIVVGATFVVSGASKVAAGPSWRASARELGAPAWTAPPVPWVELATGALLIVGFAMPWPAVAAAVLLVAFSVLIAMRLRAGEHPPCACFGQWSASPIGARHLVRNCVLLLLTLVAVL